MKIYVAKVSYGTPELFSVSVIRETPKNYIVDKDSKETLIGNFTYVSNRVNKEHPGLFFTLVEALQYLYDVLGAYGKQLSKKMFAVDENRELLITMIMKLEDEA